MQPQTNLAVQTIRRPRVIISVALFLVFTFLLQPMLLRVARATSSAPTSIYLPMVRVGATPTKPPPGNEEPKPPPAGGALFIEPNLRTSSASIQIDAQGGMHLAYHYYETSISAPNHAGSAIYAYCASQCDQANLWQRAELGRSINEIQLELTSTGRPRLLWRAAAEGQYAGMDYFYAECNQNCTDSNQWQTVHVAFTSGTAVNDVYDQDISQHYFELDNQDRPRFVFHNRNFSVEPDLYGGYYAQCNANCTQEGSWTISRFTQQVYDEYLRDWEEIRYPALAFTPQGQPRMVVEMAELEGDELGFVYLECNAGCDQDANWQRLRLDNRGSGAEVGWDIEIDKQDRTHVVFYPGAMDGGGGEMLYYVRCDGNCLDGNAWKGIRINMDPQNGQDPELEVDEQGHPHIAYMYANGNGLGHSWCDEADCTRLESVWKSQIVDSSAELHGAWPVAYPPHCDGGFWYTHTPAMALNRSGQPYFAFDGTYHARCWYDEDDGVWEPATYIHQIKRAVRVNYLPPIE